MHAPRTYEEFSVVVFWDLPWPLGDLDLGARRAKDDLCHRGAAQDWGCVPNPVLGAAKELPGLRYLVRIRLVAYQDWGLAPDQGGCDDVENDDASPDSNINCYHPSLNRYPGSPSDDGGPVGIC